MLYELNGIFDNQSKWVSVDTGQAFTNFMVMVNLNILSLKDLLNSSPEILNGPVKQIFEENGQDFAMLQRILAS